MVLSCGIEACQQVRQEPDSAAIADLLPAQSCDLEIVAQNIEDRPDNWTRFLIIGRQAIPPSGADKTSVLINMCAQPSTLRALLEPFHHHHIRVEARPTRTGSEASLLLIDFDGHQDDAVVRKVLDLLGERTGDCRVLGSYPKGVL